PSSRRRERSTSLPSRPDKSIPPAPAIASWPASPSASSAGYPRLALPSSATGAAPAAPNAQASPPSSICPTWTEQGLQASAVGSLEGGGLGRAETGGARAQDGLLQGQHAEGVVELAGGEGLRPGAQDARRGHLPEHLALERVRVDPRHVGHVLGRDRAHESLRPERLRDARAVPTVAVGEMAHRTAGALLQDALAGRDLAARLVERLVGEHGVLGGVRARLDSVPGHLPEHLPGHRQLSARRL